jgi:hypothetical protein
MRTRHKSFTELSKSDFFFAIRILAFGFALAAGYPARAATFCIAEGDVLGLQTALAQAANNNGENDVIQLQAGHYPVGQGLAFDYSPSSLEQGDLSIEGGYSEFFGNPCGLAPSVPDASSTILEGGSWKMRLSANGGSVAVKGLTIKSTIAIDVHPPFEIAADPNSTGMVSIDNVMFRDNASTAAAAIYIYTGQGALSVRNSLFASNGTFATTTGPIVLGSARVGSLCAIIANSTFVGNTSPTQPALEVATPDCPSLVANDIIWSNQPAGVAFDNVPNAYLLADDLSDITEAEGTQATDVVSVDPLFNPDYSLQDFSPLRNKGSGGGLFAPGDFDVVGQPRVYHDELPDIGAFEIQDVVFAHDFDNH